MAAAARTPRAWQRMLSGRRLDLLDPSPLDIEIEDIAHGLARVARWNGQTRGPHIFSVAQHSLLVEAIAPHLDAQLTPRARLFALLHDAPEYVIGDMISPFKAVMGMTYKAVEERILSAVLLRFSLDTMQSEALTELTDVPIAPPPFSRRRGWRDLLKPRLSNSLAGRVSCRKTWMQCLRRPIGRNRAAFLGAFPRARAE